MSKYAERPSGLPAPGRSSNSPHTIAWWMIYSTFGMLPFYPKFSAAEPILYRPYV
jgi:hypothetical protein